MSPRIFGVPAPLVGEEASNFGAGVETLAKLFYRFACRQHVSRMIDAFGCRMLPPGHRFEVDETSLLRGDTNALSKFVMALAGSSQHQPIATQEEMRHMVGLPREGGPEANLMVPMAMPANPMQKPADDGDADGEESEPDMRNLPAVFGGGSRLNGVNHDRED